ncbi:luciferase domain-containing protein [Leucobacter sp. GX24907]
MRTLRGGLPIALTIGAATAGAIWARRDYLSWIALGPGGRPHTLRGWLDVTLLRMRKGDPFDTAALRRRAERTPQAPQLEADLPKCSSPRPRIDPHPIPHRVVGTSTPEELVADLQEIFDRAEADHAAVRYAMSHYERHTPAITAEKIAFDHIDALKSHGEIGHLHPSDCSMHMVLHPLDAAKAVATGWGELHFLSDGPLLPAAYFMAYPPQRREDLPVIDRLLRAAIAYVTGEPPHEIEKAP